MKFNKAIMNPPYDGNLHLKILEKVLDVCKPEDGCEVVNLSPDGWLENILIPYKSSAYKTYLATIAPKISNLRNITTRDAQKLFNIGIDNDLGIYIFNNKQIFDLKSIRYDVVNTIFSKVYSKMATMRTVGKLADKEAVDGWRCRINELRPNSGGTNINTMGYSARTWGVQLVSSNELGISDCVFLNGYTKDNIYWTETKSKNQFAKSTGAGFPYSIKFDTEDEALNFANSCNTNFYRNWIYMIKFDQHMPLRFLPYMEDYSHVWTDEDYCKFFGLNEEESKFMCRTVDDYRVKDFINYEEF